jgi:hypothetical protein
LGGVQPNGTGAPESFSYGINYAGPLNGYLVTDKPQGDATLDDIVADCVAFHGREASKIAVNAVLKTVKIAAIGPNPAKPASAGQYLMDPYIAEVNVPGGAAFGQVYPQLALACSLNTDRRGPSGMGRFFLPMPILNMNPETFLANLPDVEAVRGSVALWIAAVNNLPGIDAPDFRVVVASTKGFNTRVESVRIGRVVDTMRSRRRQLRENYTADAPVD